MHRTHHDRSRQAGTIVNTASKQGITAPPGNTAYNGEQSRSQDLNLHGRVSRLQSALFKDSYTTSFTFSARITRLLAIKTSGGFCGLQVILSKTARRCRGGIPLTRKPSRRL